MTHLPPAILAVFQLFAPLFSYPVYQHALELFTGHILCQGRRTVADILRKLGLSKNKNFSKYHRVLNAAKWSSVRASFILFKTLSALCSNEIVIALDSTVERRKGPKIKGLGRQRDAVASTKNSKVLTVGINWLCAAIYVKFPWASVAWACPFFTVPMPPKVPLRSSKNKTDLNKSGRHKTLNQWASQLVRLLTLVHKKKVVLVADSAFCTYELANTCIDTGTSFISRLRMDARTFEFPTSTGGRGRPRLVGKRLPTFEQLVKQKAREWKCLKVRWYGNTVKEVLIQSGTCLWYGYGLRPVPIKWVLVKQGDETAVFISTNLDHNVTFIVETFVQRWRIEVTFEETRRHLGMETQRQWSDKAIDRTTPCILASYSIINLVASKLMSQDSDLLRPQKVAWYKKDHVTFSDVLKLVRSQILEAKYLLRFVKNKEPSIKQLRELLDLLAAA